MENYRDHKYLLSKEGQDTTEDIARLYNEKASECQKKTGQEIDSKPVMSSQTTVLIGNKGESYIPYSQNDLEGY